MLLKLPCLHVSPVWLGLGLKNYLKPTWDFGLPSSLEHTLSQERQCLKSKFRSLLAWSRLEPRLLSLDHEFSLYSWEQTSKPRRFVLLTWRWQRARNQDLEQGAHWVVLLSGQCSVAPMAEGQGQDQESRKRAYPASTRVLLRFLRLRGARRRDLCPCFGLRMKDEQHLQGLGVTMAVGGLLAGLKEPLGKGKYSTLLSALTPCSPQVQSPGPPRLVPPGVPETPSPRFGNHELFSSSPCRLYFCPSLC